MPIHCPACLHERLSGTVLAQARRNSVIAAAIPCLTGCTEIGLGSLGSWLFMALALALVAGLAYALGTLRARQHSQAELRAARESLHQSDRLHSDFGWQTDEHHRLQAWRAPGQPVAAACALFDPAAPDALLMSRLQAGQAFAGFRLRASRMQDGMQGGSLGWELRGVPRSDDSGRFAGFVGSAKPTDDDDSRSLAASALTPLLAANPVPCLLARMTPDGWQVQALNAAAHALWPQVGVGSALADALALLPAAVGEWVRLAGNGATPAMPALQASAAAQTAQALPSPQSPPALQDAQEVQGWRLASVLPMLPLTGCGQALLLSQVSEETPGALAHARESDTYTFTLSHDLRAPIRVVEGFTRIVKEDYGRQLDRVGNDHLDRVLGAAARMNLMIDALLTLARLSQQPLARQRVNLSQLAGYVVDDLRRGAPERSADVDIEPGLSAWGDPTLLRLVLENLLGNAWKYTGRCTHAQISLHTVPHDASTAMVVRDNGAGFDMRSADRLFGLFQRLHSTNDFPGHGVGLASVRRIVQRHGGDIWAEGEPGRGATFYFTLPN